MSDQVPFLFRLEDPFHLFSLVPPTNRWREAMTVPS